MKKETWKFIPGYEGYGVSDLGRVRSLNYRHTGKTVILKARKSSNGYFSVVLYKNGICCQKRINRLVWEAFNGEIPEGMEINHIDENPLNNRLDNLNLMTRKENNNYGTINQRRSDKLKNRCDISKNVRQMTYPDRIFVKIWPSTNEAGRNGFSESHVAACCRGERKQHKGFIFEYI